MAEISLTDADRDDFVDRLSRIINESETLCFLWALIPYLLMLVRYIHLNPPRAGIVADLDRLEIYVYGGHGRLTGCLTDEWQSVDGVFSFWGKQQRTFRRHCGWVWMGQPWQYEWG